MTASAQAASRRLAAIGALVALVIAVLVLLAAATPSPAQAATWHTKLSAAGHHSKTCGPATLVGSRETRLRYWTAKVWDADDDGDEAGEWEYDWVKFKLIRTDTGATVRTFGPYYHPTGYKDWSKVSIKLPAGGHAYKVRSICDDARFGMKLQQKY